MKISSLEKRVAGVLVAIYVASIAGGLYALLTMP